MNETNLSVEVYASEIERRPSAACFSAHRALVLDAGTRWEANRPFAELAQKFLSFEFLHGHGLGILAVGTSAPPAIEALCTLADSADVATVRERFSHLGAPGKIIKDLAQERRLRPEKTAPLRQRVEVLEAEIQNFERTQGHAIREIISLRMSMSK
jgi:hypothetical protein